MRNKNITDKQVLPVHIGIILDGNGRWATKRGLPRSVGHKAGIEAVNQTIINCNEMGIKYVSLFAFSTENWKRNEDEVNTIFNLLRDYLSSHTLQYNNLNIKVNAFGDITKFPKDLIDELEKTIAQTKNNTGTVVNLCVNYGSRDEIIRAVNLLIKSGKKHVEFADFEDCLYSAGQPNPDFIIRTSGEHRLSNFMLYQCAYSEFYFPEVLWPDFDKKQLEIAIKEYQSRDRRYGDIKEKK